MSWRSWGASWGSAWARAWGFVASLGRRARVHEYVRAVVQQNAVASVVAPHVVAEVPSEAEADPQFLETVALVAGPVVVTINSPRVEVSAQ